MPTKHIVVVHGRATKPRKEEKLRLVKLALVHGLRRVDQAAADAVEGGEVKLTLAYYGDRNNMLLVRAGKADVADMVQGPPPGDSTIGGTVYYERDGSYDADLRRLMDRPTDRHTREAYKALLDQVRDLSAVDDLARAFSPVLALFGLSSKAIRRFLPDMGAYLTTRVEGSEMRDRLQRPLRQALAGGDDVALVSHSMGCVVSYDVLWKFSRMSEYRDVRDRRVSLWLTLGSPLGEPGVQDNVYDVGEPDDGRCPTNIVSWVNVAAHDDFVAHDGDMADDFRGMGPGTPGNVRIEDRPRIYNFWVGRDGSNPHKLYGYLNHPAVASELVAWIGRS